MHPNERQIVRMMEYTKQMPLDLIENLQNPSKSPWARRWHQSAPVTCLPPTLKVDPNHIIRNTRKRNITNARAPRFFLASNPNLWTNLVVQHNWDPMPRSHTNHWVMLCLYVNPSCTEPSMRGSQTDLWLYLSSTNPPGSQCHHGQSLPKSHGSNCALSQPIAAAP